MKFAISKRGFAIAFGIGLSALLSLGAAAHYIPLTTVVVDFDESLVLRLNTFGRVLSAQGFNNDNSFILNEPLYEEMRGKTAEEAVGMAINNIILERRLHRDKNKILITTTIAPQRAKVLTRGLQLIAERVAGNSLLEINVIVHSNGKMTDAFHAGGNQVNSSIEPFFLSSDLNSRAASADAQTAF
jgi:hypothetical protein